MLNMGKLYYNMCIDILFYFKVQLCLLDIFLLFSLISEENEPDMYDDDYDDTYDYAARRDLVNEATAEFVRKSVSKCISFKDAEESEVCIKFDFSNS